MRPSNKCLEKFISFVILSKFLFLQKEKYKNEMEIEKRVFFLKYKEHFFMLLCFLCFEMNNNVEAKKKKILYTRSNNIDIEIDNNKHTSTYHLPRRKNSGNFLVKTIFFHSFQLEKHAEICKKNRWETWVFTEKGIFSNDNIKHLKIQKLEPISHF